MQETWIDSTVAFSGPIFAVRTGQVRLHSGATARRDVVEHAGGVAVVPVTDGEIILVRQFRIAAGRVMVELPAGKLEPGEDPAACARRELMEELGYAAGTLIPLRSYFSSSGFTSERMYVFLARDLVETGRNLDWDEHIEPLRYPLERIPGLLAAGEVEDAKTIIGLYDALAYLRDDQR